MFVARARLPVLFGNKGDLMNGKGVRFDWLDWLLMLAIVVLTIVLLVMLGPPMIEAWRNRPRPGMQVAQQCLIPQSNDADAIKIPIDYLIYLPPGYNQNKKWPLVVHLHGAGERGQDLGIVRRVGVPKQIEQGIKFDFIAISPQCPANSYWNPELVVGLIEHISRSFSIDRDRVYLTGFSMGGYGTWRTACYKPELFAAIAPLAGGGDVEQAKQLANLPVWAFHGSADQTVPFDASKKMVDAVKKSGGHVEFTVLQGQGHGIDEAVYSNPKLYEWMLSKRRGPTTNNSK
jgi:predicted peptidase